jgi:hypothetical protein
MTGWSGSEAFTNDMWAAWEPRSKRSGRGVDRHTMNGQLGGPG